MEVGVALPEPLGVVEAAAGCGVGVVFGLVAGVLVLLALLPAAPAAELNCLRAASDAVFWAPVDGKRRPGVTHWVDCVVLLVGKSGIELIACEECEDMLLDGSASNISSSSWEALWLLSSPSRPGSNGGPKLPKGALE